MIRGLAWALALLIGLAAALVWQGQMHHLRALLPGALPSWTAALPDSARLVSGRMALPSDALGPGLQIGWSARLPAGRGWRWDLRLTGPGIDVAGDLALAFGGGRAVLDLTGGTLDLGRLLPVPVPVAGAAEVTGGQVRIEDLRGAPGLAGRAEARIVRLEAAGADLGGGPAEAVLESDATWRAEARLSGGATPVRAEADGTRDGVGRYRIVFEREADLPERLRVLLAAAGHPEGAGWVIEGTLRR